MSMVYSMQKQQNYPASDIFRTIIVHKKLALVYKKIGTLNKWLQIESKRLADTTMYFIAA